MRHAHSLRKLGVDRDSRKSMLRNLMRSVVVHERIETTVARAKEAQPLVERLITLGRTGDLTARRTALSMLPDPDVVKRVFGEIAPRYAGRNGGYTRILRTRDRKGDGASLCYLELVERRVDTPAAPPVKKPAAPKEEGAVPGKTATKKPKAKKEAAAAT